MKVLCLYSEKGGVGRTTLAPYYCAGLKTAFPSSRVGLMDLSHVHGALSKRYALEKEQTRAGVWSIIEALVDPRAQRDPDHLQKAVWSSTTKLQVSPSSPGRDGCIYFLNIGIDTEFALGGPKVVGNLVEPSRLGDRVLAAIEEALRLDFLVVDFHGYRFDPLVLTFMPHCYSAIMPIDVRGPVHLDEVEAQVAWLRGMEVDVRGFLRVFTREGKRASATQKAVEDLLYRISLHEGVPILRGGIPDCWAIQNGIEPSGNFRGTVCLDLCLVPVNDPLKAQQPSLIQQAVTLFESASFALFPSPVA